MPGGRPPKSIALHLVQGTYRNDRHAVRAKAERVIAQAERDGHQPTDDQRKLLAALPRDLAEPCGSIARQLVVSTPGLAPIHRPLVVALAEASARHHVASVELNRLMLDRDGMCDPDSETAQAARLYMKIIDQALSTMERARKVLRPA